MNKDNYEFEDMESSSFHSGKDELNIKTIILNHVRKICLLSCEEFIGGYHNIVSEWHGEIRFQKRVYVPDARAKYSQAVDRLYDLLMPFFDKPFNLEDDKIQKMPIGTPDKKLEKTRALFQQLNKLLNRRDYLNE